MAANQAILDATIRNAVFLEQLKSGEVKKFAPILLQLFQTLRDRLTRADLTTFTVKRLETLLADIDGLLAGIFNTYTEQLSLDLEDLAGYEAQFEAASLSRAAPVGFVFDAILPGAAAIRSAMLTNPLSVRGADGGKLLGTFIEGFTSTERQRLAGTIRQGFFEGRTNFQIIMDIRGTKAAGYNDGVLATTNRNAGAIIRTAVQHVATQARMETLKANPDVVQSVEWVSTLDSKTTAQCRTLDKRRFKLSEGPRPPIHINCRSTVVAVTNFSALFGKGATRASVGSSEAQQVRADLSYYEWLRQQPAAFQDQAIGKARGALFRNGGLSIDRFAELQLDRNFKPLTLVQMKGLEPLAFDRANILG